MGLLCVRAVTIRLKAAHCPMQPTAHGKEGSSEELRGELLVSP